MSSHYYRCLFGCPESPFGSRRRRYFADCFVNILCIYSLRPRLCHVCPNRRNAYGTIDHIHRHTVPSPPRGHSASNTTTPHSPPRRRTCCSVSSSTSCSFDPRGSGAVCARPPSSAP